MSRAPMGPWPHFADDEIAAVERVLRSGRINYWTGGEGSAFESEYAAYTGVRHAVAVANGTLALELALHALGIGPGHDVVVPARTFIATATAVVARGARPVVCDVDPESGNATAATVEAALTPATRAVIPVHLAGWPCDMTAIRALAEDRGLFVIEDCAQAHGARWEGRAVGSFGDVNAFSFCQDKIVTTCGEGGMVTTDVEALWRRAWEYKDHGRSWDAVQAAKRASGPSYKPLYESFGTNWRLTEPQAAVGRIQLGKLDGWVEARRRNAAILDERFSGISALRVVRPPADARHAYYKYYVHLDPACLKAGWSRDRVVGTVQDAGVPCFTGICPEIYLEKAFSDCGLAPKGRLPAAKALGETSVMLLVHPTLGEDDMHLTADTVIQVLKEATR